MKKFFGAIRFALIGAVAFLVEKFTKPRLSKAERAEQKRRDESLTALVKYDIEEKARLTRDIKESLLVGLPHALQGLDTFFQDLPRVSKHEMDSVYLPDEKKVREAGEPYASKLLPYGLELTDLYYAILAFDRLLDHLSDLGQDVWDKYQGGAFHLGDRLFMEEAFQKALTFEVAMWLYGDIKDNSVRVARGMVEWLMTALQHKPRILPGYIAKIDGSVMRFEADPEIHDLDFRWKIYR